MRSEGDAKLPSRARRRTDDVLSRSMLAAGGGGGDAPGALDARWESRAEALAPARFSSSAFAELSAPAPVAAKAEGPETLYIAIDEQGRAGPVGEAALASAARRKIDALQMSIVAAVPPAPPPLETMTIGAAAAPAPAHARRRPEKPGEKEDDAVSHSKIEGSVDAIAQRIYHRIRRRIESDRERFGG
jgi:hypothetical protein